MEQKTANAKVLLLPNNLTNSKQQHFGNFSVIRASDMASTVTYASLASPEHITNRPFYQSGSLWKPRQRHE